MNVLAVSHHGFTVSSTVSTLVTVALVAFVVWKAWRGSKRQVVSAMAKAIAQVRAEVTAHAAAQAVATNTVQVNVGGGTAQLAQLPPDTAAHVAALLAALGVDAGQLTATPAAPVAPVGPLDGMERAISSVSRPTALQAARAHLQGRP